MVTVFISISYIQSINAFAIDYRGLPRFGENQGHDLLKGPKGNTGPQGPKGKSGATFPHTSTLHEFSVEQLETPEKSGADAQQQTKTVFPEANQSSPVCIL